MPLKLGDYVLIDHGGFDKNNFRAILKITSAPGYKDGINWDEKMVNTSKIGVNSKSVVWSMEWIKEVCDGKDDLSMEKFVKKLDIEHMEAAPETYGNFNLLNYFDSNAVKAIK